MVRYGNQSRQKTQQDGVWPLGEFHKTRWGNLMGIFKQEEFRMIWIPSGKRLHNYGKSPFLMGKLTINGHFQ